MPTRRLITDEALLRRACSPCGTVAEGLRIGRELLDFVRKYNRERIASQAAGLAAPQLGILKQVCVITTNPKRPLVLVNPRLVKASEVRLPWTESCISLPRKKVETFRHTWVEIMADNLSQPLRRGLDSPAESLDRKKMLESVCCQHELAHLQGKIIFDFQSDEDYWTVISRKGNLSG